MKGKKLKLESGTLWQRTLECTERALRTGTLQSIDTERIFISDGGVDFLVRIVSNLARKSEEKKMVREVLGIQKKKINPFLPYDEDMFVADISDTHVCLLNKFNVIDHHLLIVTRAFEDQETLLTLKDFEAIRSCMVEFEGLAFYNGGVVAGASQDHKHLQLIPLPMEKSGLTVPMDSLFTDVRLDDKLGVIPGLPFIHCFARMDRNLVKDTLWKAKEIFRLYREMLQNVGLNNSCEPEESIQSGPYNLLFTNEWMLLVPRSEELFESISINALGFAGALLVQNKQQLQILKEHGGMAVLKHTAVTD